jgi:hypothetical protein
MSSWTSGYVAEIDYTHGYYREMSPSLLRLAMLNKLQAHRVERPLTYLELGFGQGLSLNIHAAANAGEFWGTDFNPTQASNAKELAAASGANTRVLDSSFAELARRDDLPEFDIIALHGIWSWISPENRRVIVDIARRKLAVGGILYVSYNTTPGWSAAIPLRHLMMLHLELASPEALGLVPRMDAAIAFAESVVDSKALYFRANPAVAERLKALKGMNRNYLAHEFFNADWHPMPFSEVAAYLDMAKLSFAASSNLSAHIDAVCLTPAQQQLLASIAHPVLRESVRDYCENQQFRRDIFVKGPRALTHARQIDLFRSQRFALTTHEGDVPLKVTGPLGEANLQPDIYRPVIAALAENGYAPKSVQQLSDHASLKTASMAQIIQALVVLTGIGHAHPAQEEAAIGEARATADALNAHLMERAVHSGDVTFLASPVTGAGVHVGRIHQLFLRALRRGKKTPQEWAVDLWPVLEAQGQRLIREGKPLATAVENISELTTMAQEFAAKRLPILKMLLVAQGPGDAATFGAPERRRTAA